MGFTERKAELFEIDARWNIRVAFRMLMNLICVVSIIFAVMTINKTSGTKFQPKPFLRANKVLIYVPCVCNCFLVTMSNAHC
jgi:hypothetical protein